MVAPNTTYISLLEELGLTANESQVYLSILGKGNVTAAEVARSLAFDKSSTYRACEHLLKHGLLISSPQKRGTTLIAQNPEVLKELYHQKMGSLENLGGQLNQTISELKKNAQTSSRNIQIRTEYGIEAVRRVMNESLESKDKLIREWEQTDKQYYKDPTQIEFVLKYVELRVKAGINIRQIESDTRFRETAFKNIMSSGKLYLKEIRMMPGGFEDSNTLRIWDDNVNAISYDDQGNFVVVTIHDKFFTRLFRNLFDFVWNKSELYNEANANNKPR